MCECVCVCRLACDRSCMYIVRACVASAHVRAVCSHSPTRGVAPASLAQSNTFGLPAQQSNEFGELMVELRARGVLLKTCACSIMYIYIYIYSPNGACALHD